MQAHHYPFIDLAVHASIRDRFSKGDAVAVLSPDLGGVLWANGAAASLFGFDNIYDALDEGLAGQVATRRQIESALSGLRRTGRRQAFMMRLSSGFSRSMTPASLEDITLPDGERALLLVSSQAGQILSPGARARQIISGFEGTGTHVAVLDKDGRVLAASSTFDEIGLAQSDIDRMIADVAADDDRLVKRMTEARTGPMPTAIGRLADEPRMHLLFAVEPQPHEETDAGTEEVPAPLHAEDAAPSDEVAAELSPEPRSGSDLEDDTEAVRPTETSATGEEANDGPGNIEAPAGIEHAAPSNKTASEGDDEVDTMSDVAEVHDGEGEQESVPAGIAPPEESSVPRRVVFDTSRIRDELNARLEKARAEQAREDNDIPLPFADARDLNTDLGADLGGSSEAGADTSLNDDPQNDEQLDGTDKAAPDEDLVMATQPDQPEASGEDDVAVTDDDIGADGPEFRFDPNSKPARFVWKINRDGKFSEVSPEFALAVGPHSADIVGRSFPDLARVFNLDPDHVISELLSRRDTWSGKTVYWPIQGTSLSTPVDLAALPTYTRDRQFDGFRGFGIVRIGETREDPEALGLALVPGARSRPAEQTPPDEDPVADETDETAQTVTPDQLNEIVQDAEDIADLELRSLERDIEDLARMDGADGEATDETGEIGDNIADTPAEAGSGPQDPFRGERPAIRLVETPGRRDSDKVIDLEARRTRPRDSLSPGEQAAFREIGVRLNETSAATTGTPDTGAESASPEQQLDRPAFGKRQTQANDDQPDPGDIEINFDGNQAGDTTGDSAGDPDNDTVAASAADETVDDAPSQPEELPEQLAEPASQDFEPIETPALPLPSAFALPARQVMPAGIDAGLVDAIPAALLVHCGDELIHANAEFLDLTGYGSLSELAARGGLDHLLDPSDEDDEDADGAMIVRRADGTACKVTARLRSVNWADGQALLLALSPVQPASAGVTATLVTAVEPPAGSESGTAQAEEPEDAGEPDAGVSDEVAALKIEAQELRSILETATDGVVILDDDGTIRSMNGSACALFNYDENETRGQPFAMLFAHESQRAVMDYVSGLAEHGVSSVLNDGREVIGREAAGGFLPLFMTIGRLSGSNGYCAVLRDITQWKRTEDELRNAKRAAETANSHKSDFLARVSHEIRTPLNAIIGFSEMMVEERFGPIGSPRYLEYAHDIGNSGKHVLDIVNDLLDISKIEAGQEQMEFVAVSLNEHLAESVSLLQPMANSQRVIIRTSLSASVPEVVADRRSIKQIALNLLSNAIRFTPSGGQIVVSTSYEPSGNVVIRIRDTGIGMNRKELEQAMKPFGQVGPGPRQRGDGTGLGLPLTKAMVEANRAQFDIVSTPSEGTLVSIAFPPQRVLAD